MKTYQTQSLYCNYWQTYRIVYYILFKKCCINKAESHSYYPNNRLAMFIAFCFILLKIFSQLRETATKYKERARIFTFGKSYEGRQLFGVEVNMAMTFVSVIKIIV